MERKALDVKQKTRLAIIFSNLIHEPFASLYVWLPFILRKDLFASVFQISLLMTLKPVISIVSFYWSSHRPDSVRSAFVWAGVLARIPFLFFPFIDNIWYFIFASTVYMLFYRAAIPPWMEILNLNLEKKKRQKYFSLGSALGYGEGVFLALYLGQLLDQHTSIWRILFCLFASLGIMGILIQGIVPIKGEKEREKVADKRGVSLIKPWQDTWRIMRSRPDFAHFQWGFMAAGFGIMLVIAVTPYYFADILELSHSDFANARYIFMGLGFLVCTPSWSRVMSRVKIPTMTALVFICFSAFPILLFLARVNFSFLYASFIAYGIAQSGSHMLWHLSGPLFARDENSSIFSGINIVMVGIRGMIAPMLGGFLYTRIGSYWVLVIGMGFCLLSAWFTLFKQPASETLESAS